MKNLQILFVFSLVLLSQLAISQTSKLIKVQQFNHAPEKGYLHSLTEDTISLMRTMDVHGKPHIMLHHFPVKNVKSVSIKYKRDFRPLGIIGGGFIGALPGIMILNDAKNLNTLESLFFGPSYAATGLIVAILGSVGGAILGGIIAKPKYKNIDIFGQKDVYNKNMENIRNFAY